MANYVFKYFCAELDQASLANLLKIIATPNENAAEMVEGVEEDDGSSGDEEEAYGSEDEDSSD